MRRLAVTLLILAAAPAQAAVPVTGNWLTPDGKAVIGIGPCGGGVCGRVVRMAKVPVGVTTDINNPDPAQRRRPLMGLEVLSGFADTGSDWRGRIYDPKNGKSYKSILTREADGSLKVQGCIAFFCKTQRWTRAN